ncbi:MAG: hypothetical protein IK080_07545 [Clostridia bacterium]|nr:hypothetical protein [Clostridia bacterium]
MSVFFAILRKSVYLFFALTFLIGGLLSTPSTVEGPGLTLEREIDYFYSDGAAFCQGITTDGRSFYGTGCIKPLFYNAIVRIDMESGDVLESRDLCLPYEMIRLGYSHLGDGAYFDGKLYIACETNTFKDPAVMVYDAESLDFLAYHVLPPEGQGNGHFPWLCIRDGVIYYTQAREVSEVRMLSLTDFSFLGSIPMDREITKIAGGDLLGDTLYLSADSDGGKKITYAVNLATGETKDAFVRDTGNEATEAEGLVIYSENGRTYFCYVDVLWLCNASIRIYSFEQE